MIHFIFDFLCHQLHQKFNFLKSFFIFMFFLNLMGCQYSKINQDNLTNTSLIDIRTGFELLEKNNMIESKEKFLEALKKNPRNPAAWYALGFYNEKIGNKILAEKNYQRAIQIDPNSGEAHNNYGTFLCREKRFEQAIKEFNVAANETNYLNAADAYENAGRCLLKIPNKSLAKEYFLKAIKNDPNRKILLSACLQATSRK